MMETNNTPQQQQHINDFIQRLKNADEGKAATFKRFLIVYAIFIIVYLISIAWDFEKSIAKKFEISFVMHIAGRICFLIGLILGTLLLKLRYQEYKFADYAQPTLVMLKKAVRRYSPFRTKPLWLVCLIILFLGAGWRLLTYATLDFIGNQLALTGGVCCGLVIGVIFWRYRCKPIHDELLRLIREMEEEEEV